MDYEIIPDILLVKHILSCTDSFLAEKLNISRSTLNRWISKTNPIPAKAIESFYTFAFKNNIKINEIKSQFLIEENKNENNIILFHGAKDTIDLPIDLSHSKQDNDLGIGFYCGESLKQSAMYTAGYKNSSAYVFSFDLNKLKGLKLNVDLKWMLAIAYYRGKLDNYKDHEIIVKIRNEIENSDYIIAPIADNKMFSLINNFIDGELTDEQCKHCLSSTNLGNQYVFKTKKALNNLKVLARLYFCEEEKNAYLNEREENIKIGNDKVKAARSKYAGKGKYINDILG